LLPRPGNLDRTGRLVHPCPEAGWSGARVAREELDEVGGLGEAPAKGNLEPDAYLAALAIESASEWITTDRDFSRFPGLRWRHPLATS